MNEADDGASEETIAVRERARVVASVVGGGMREEETWSALVNKA